ncbi:putative MFS family arabinose efflux permease [Isoptericola sp. CG 20/1183]|uniref:MFS family arabinose efflux permease n=1 Tax=Isoptericola halotolerans TaxID=300560 RepID=A0ABX5ED03_9MICO|nr:MULTISPECIES: MFS transporter [Isoptericola]PRZ05716.1 putative MFS family arabinose efflux permease [Isoptericola halotolerans]PRZ06284.1 putative MFS family arabinose efflux permease [Isoptericola sp. CG 20/1183]
MTLTQYPPTSRAGAPPAPGSDGPTLVEAMGRTYFPLAFVARLPFAMMVVGVLTLVVAGRDSLTLGGATSGMVGLGGAAIGPLVGAWADRAGQRRVLLATAAVHSVLLLALTAVVYSSASDALVLAIAFAIGATSPQVPPMSRSRLVGVIRSRLPAGRRPAVLSRTMSYESAVDEIVFVFGPFVVGLLAATLGPTAPMVAAAALTALAVGTFALHPSARTTTARTTPAASDPGVASGGQAPARELFRPRVLVLVAGFVGVGLFFGSVLTAMSAYTGDAGHAEQAGLLYGFMGIGSVVSALAVSAFPARFSLRARWLTFAVVLLVGAVVVAAAPSTGVLIAGLLLAGLGIGPSLVTVYSHGSERSPDGRGTTVMTMLGSAVILGQSIAAAATGALADTVGTSAALAVPVVAAGVVLASAAANWRLTGR